MFVICRGSRIWTVSQTFSEQPNTLTTSYSPSMENLADISESQVALNEPKDQ